MQNQLEIPTGTFSFVEAHRLFDEGLLKNHLDCKNYIKKYFHPTATGTHILFVNGKPEIVQNDTMSTVYVNRFDPETEDKQIIKKWYSRGTIPKQIICDINKPIMTEEFINLSPQVKHKYKPFESFLPKIKEKLNTMIDYIKLVWADGNEEVFIYLMKWFSNVIKGIKNKSCLYAKGPEGIGKSTLTDFVRDFVVGRDLYAKGKADHLKGNNSQLLGKIFVVFEELQCFSDKEWRAVDSELKDMITDEDGSYCDKYEKRFRAPNINNYVVNTNFNAIKGANGRRYFVVNLNTSKQNNHTYFKNIMSQCFNDEVGHAFFSYLYEIDTSTFNALDMPETQNKSDLCIELMQTHELFLKDVYILNQRGLGNARVSDVYNKYVDYCTSKKQNQISPQRFCQEMRNLNIPYKKISVNKFENITYEFLYNLASKKKWLHDLDNDFKVAEEDEVEVMNNLDGKPTERHYTNNNEMKNVMDKNIALEKRIQELELKQIDNNDIVNKLEKENKRLREQNKKNEELKKRIAELEKAQQPQQQYLDDPDYIKMLKIMQKLNKTKNNLNLELVDDSDDEEIIVPAKKAPPTKVKDVVLDFDANDESFSDSDDEYCDGDTDITTF
jgi:hypothetical protein